MSNWWVRMPTIAILFTAIFGALVFIELKIWIFVIFSLGWIFNDILKPPVFSYRTDLFVIKFSYRIEQKRQYVGSFWHEFLGCYLPRCMVDNDATFLYANSIVVPTLGGSKYRFWLVKNNFFFLVCNSVFFI